MYYNISTYTAMYIPNLELIMDEIMLFNSDTALKEYKTKKANHP